MSVGFCAFLQPHSSARDAFVGPIHESPPARLAQKLRIRYGLNQQLTELYEIGPFEADIEMTPALGDIDGDDKTDIVVQPLTGGLIYCLEFDNSDYDSASNSKGWPCMGRNAARTHCAD